VIATLDSDFNIYRRYRKKPYLRTSGYCGDLFTNTKGDRFTNIKGDRTSDVM
jgi:hypothetical protein